MGERDIAVKRVPDLRAVLAQLVADSGFRPDLVLAIARGGLAVAGGLWAWRIYAIETGLSGRTATAPVVFDARQWTLNTEERRGRYEAWRSQGVGRVPR